MTRDGHNKTASKPTRYTEATLAPPHDQNILHEVVAYTIKHTTTAWAFTHTTKYHDRCSDRPTQSKSATVSGEQLSIQPATAETQSSRIIHCLGLPCTSFLLPLLVFLLRDRVQDNLDTKQRVTRKDRGDERHESRRSLRISSMPGPYTCQVYISHG